MRDQADIIENMRTRIKLEDYGLENVNHLLFTFCFRFFSRICTCLNFSQQVLIFRVHTPAMMTLGTSKASKKTFK